MVEGAGRSGRQKGEGFGERGRAGVKRGWDLQAGLVLFFQFFSVFFYWVFRGSAGGVFTVFFLFLGLPGGSCFVHFSEKYSFLPKSAPAPFLHTVQRFGLISRVLGLPK